MEVAEGASVNISLLDEHIGILLLDLDELTQKLHDFAGKRKNFDTNESCAEILNQENNSTIREVKKVKTLAAQSLTQDLLEEPVGHSQESTDPAISLGSFLLEKIEGMNEMITKMENELSLVQAEIEANKTRAITLEQVAAQRQTTGEMVAHPDWDTVAKKVKTHRSRLASDVRRVINTLFPSDSVTINVIFNNAMKAYYTNDPYVEEREKWKSAVEVLLRAKIIVRHPVEKKYFRLVDFL